MPANKPEGRNKKKSCWCLLMTVFRCKTDWMRASYLPI